MERLTLALLACALVARGEALPTAPTAAAPEWRATWRLSIATMAAAEALDVASSVGGQELNGLLRRPDGTFSPARGIAIKGGVVSGLVIAELILAKRNPRLYKGLSMINFGITGATGVVVGVNLTRR